MNNDKPDQTEHSKSAVIGHLDRLAGELAGEDWRSLPRYGHDPAFLRVWHPDLEGVGMSVGALRLPGSEGDAAVWWYVMLPDVALSPCDDVSGAIDEIAGLLRPWVMAARARRAAS